jgi:acetylornithine deacetylase/succinyl-diaminopimelate desuccinylase-like protein
VSGEHEYKWGNAGRGACDAKAMLACMSLVANKLVQQHAHIANQLALLFVVGEEAGHHGMIVCLGYTQHVGPQNIFIASFSCPNWLPRIL